MTARCFDELKPIFAPLYDLLGEVDRLLRLSVEGSVPPAAFERLAMFYGLAKVGIIEYRGADVSDPRKSAPPEVVDQSSLPSLYESLADAALRLCRLKCTFRLLHNGGADGTHTAGCEQRRAVLAKARAGEP